MATRRVVVLDPQSASPIFGDAETSRIVELPAGWKGDGPALRKALDSGLIVEHKVGRAVGKKAAEATETETTTTEAPKPTTPPKTPPKAK